MIDEYQATNYMMNLSSSYSASQTGCLLITISYRFHSRIVSCISQSDSVPLSERDDKWPLPCCALHRALIIVQSDLDTRITLICGFLLVQAVGIPPAEDDCHQHHSF